MQLLTELFSSAEGILSLIVIVFMLLMAAYFINMFVRKMNNEEPK